MRSGKIIATLGPAITPKTILNKAIKYIDAFRLNMSHAKKEETENLIKTIRIMSHDKVFILDTKGPEIRTRVEKLIELEADDIIIIANEHDDISSKYPIVRMTYDEIQDIPMNTPISFDDDKVVGIVEKKSGNGKVVKITEGGPIGINKTVNFRGYDPKIDFLTNQDLEDIKWGCKMEISIIAASFVKSADDINKLRDILKSHGNEETKIIAKIETVSALENIEEIIQASDGIMIARGDLGANVSIINLPKIQNDIVELCNKYGTPVILATQVLSSMVTNSKPSRAEVDEIAYSILSGVDCFMLSDETAIGKHPIKTLEYLNNIIINYQDEISKQYSRDELKPIGTSKNSDYILVKAMEVSKEVDIKLIICPTETGHTPSRISALKPNCPIFTFTKSEKVFRYCSIMWGVKTFKVGDDISYNNIKRIAKSIIKKEFKGDIDINARILIVHSSVMQNSSGMINGLEIIKYKYLD